MQSKNFLYLKLKLRAFRTMRLLKLSFHAFNQKLSIQLTRPGLVGLISNKTLICGERINSSKSSEFILSLLRLIGQAERVPKSLRAEA